MFECDGWACMFFTRYSKFSLTTEIAQRKSPAMLWKRINTTGVISVLFWDKLGNIWPKIMFYLFCRNCIWQQNILISNASSCSVSGRVIFVNMERIRRQSIKFIITRVREVTAKLISEALQRIWYFCVGFSIFKNILITRFFGNNA